MPNRAERDHNLPQTIFRDVKNTAAHLRGRGGLRDNNGKSMTSIP